MIENYQSEKRHTNHSESLQLPTARIKSRLNENFYQSRFFFSVKAMSASVTVPTICIYFSLKAFIHT